MGKDKIKV